MLWEKWIYEKLDSIFNLLVEILKELKKKG